MIPLRNHHGLSFQMNLNAIAKLLTLVDCERIEDFYSLLFSEYCQRLWSLGYSLIPCKNVNVTYCGGCCCFPPFVVYSLGQNQKWMKQNCSQNCLIDPKGQLIQFSNAIIFEGKFFAPSLQGTLAVIEETHESQFQVTRLNKRSNRMVDKVEVFKLQIEIFVTTLEIEPYLRGSIVVCQYLQVKLAAETTVYFTHQIIEGWRL